MTPQHPLNPDWSRRDLLKKAGVAGAGLMAAPLVAACGATGISSGKKDSGSGAHDVTGKFSWTKAKGTTLQVLQTPHPYQQTYAPLLKEFTALTGVKLNVTLVDEADYFTKLNTDLAGGAGTPDVFMLGAYYVWTYGPPGWLEDLKPWLANTSATSPSYDFADLFPFLRQDTQWDFVNGHPLGSGGQYALPWGWEMYPIAYNQALFKKKGIKPPETFGNLMDVAIHLTDRSAGNYGIAFRGSKSWATIHPGYMSGFTRHGATDFKAGSGGKLTATMNSAAGTEFTDYWAQLAKKAGPTAWTTYDYPACTRDLGNGVAAMVWDADAATYPKNVPGQSREAGHLAWYPGPKGPSGLATNIWTWAWGLNSASKNKLAAWLFIQWATGKESMTKGVNQGTFANPVRQSVFHSTFKNHLASLSNHFPGYLDSFNALEPHAKIEFTPQKQYFNTTENWAVALENIYGGSPGPSTMNSLAKSSTSAV